MGVHYRSSKQARKQRIIITVSIFHLRREIKVDTHSQKPKSYGKETARHQYHVETGIIANPGAIIIEEEQMSSYNIRYPYCNIQHDCSLIIEFTKSAE